MSRRREESHEVVAVSAIDEHSCESGVIEGDVGAPTHCMMNEAAGAGRVLETELSRNHAAHRMPECADTTRLRSSGHATGGRVPSQL